MILPRLMAILIIGGGYMLSRAIFSAWPLNKEQLEDKETKSISISMWIVGFGIIIGQLIYIWVIFSRVFATVESISFIFLFFKIVITGLIVLLLYKNIRG
ncbi:MAG: hypothetical protein ISS80_05360 [Candidatus Cloacimonetes bacterium]|nr:hypothetical protein [Candidatus Cloacimonadota bacterium]MBL7149482.1 hypothetical protein [Candidatus Cloacimonadota bacterium]